MPRDWVAAPGGGLPDRACAPATPRRLRRLSLPEYSAAVRDLVGRPVPAVQDLLPDAQVNGFANHAETLVIASGRFDELALVAEQAAAQVDVEALAACRAAEPRDACATRFILALGRRAFGRPLDDAEAARLRRLHDEAVEVGGPTAGLRLVLESLLGSPHFLYRTELGGDAGGALSSHEVARQLAFALTGGPPDPELASAADRDELRERAAVRRQVLRLAQTPTARAHVAGFLRAWLGLGDVRSIYKVQLYAVAGFSEATKAALDGELDLLLDYALSPGGGTWSALVGQAVAFASKRTAHLYAGTLEAPATEATFSGDAPVRLATRPELRRGILAMPVWLAAHSPVHRTSPVERGLAVRSRFFCQSLPQPPPTVSSAVVDATSAGQTVRDRFEAHSRDPACRGCHALIDPIGFGFENMDTIGRLRSEDGGVPVNASGALVGTDVDGPFTGPAELAERLVRSRQARDCFVVELFRFIEGRDETPADACELRPLQDYFADEQRKVVDLLVELVSRGSAGRRRPEP